MDMLRCIKLFVAAVEAQSFSGAAQRENATQSGVSQHIKKLEEKLGTVLFRRTTTAVIPTPAGEAYYRYCIRILSNLSEAEFRLKSLRGESNEISIGLPPWLTRRVLAPALMKLKQQHPNTQVRIVEAHSATLAEAVKNCELSFAIVHSPVHLHEARRQAFVRSQELIVGARHRGHGDAASAQGPLKLVLPGRDSPRRHRVETYCEMNGLEIADIFAVESVLCALDIVATSDWVTILPSMILATEPDHLRFHTRQLTNPTLSFDLISIEPPSQRLDTATQDLLSFLRIEAEIQQDQFLGLRGHFCINTR